MKWKCSEEKARASVRTENVQPLFFHCFAHCLLPTGDGDENLGDHTRFPPTAHKIPCTPMSTGQINVDIFVYGY